MAKTPKRPAKHLEPLKRARELFNAGRYRDSRHSTERQVERGIILPEIIQVITTGWHEKSKDEFKVEWNSWNYAIRGKTVDKRELRVAVAFEDRDTLALIVTAIDLGAE